MRNNRFYNISRLNLIALFVFVILLTGLVGFNSSRTIDTTYSTAQFYFSAERDSFFSTKTCARFNWSATYNTEIYLNDELVESPGEATLCNYGDVKGVLTVVYQDGNPITYGIQIPGLLGTYAKSILAFVVLLATITFGPYLTKKFRSWKSAGEPEWRFSQVIRPRLHFIKIEQTDTLGLKPIWGLCGDILKLLAPLVIIQAFYPIALHDAWSNWALYWLYVSVGIVLPGTLFLLSTVNWTTDRLTWIGLGWATGHGLELVTLLIAKRIGTPDLFVIWIPLAYILGFLRRGKWGPRITPLPNKIRVGVSLLFLFLIGAFFFISLNLPEMSPEPPYVSDVWFHINNAHEFRDHSNIQDPRLAGEAFNYHMYSYAPAATASLFTGIPVVNLINRFTGLSGVWLLTLLLFNTGRVISGGSVRAGTFSALLIVLPLDFFALFSAEWTFGTFIMFYGVYISTTTLGGFIFLAGLLLLLYFYFQRADIRDIWVIALFAFAGAGSKSMFGPLIICAVFGIIGWQWLFQRKRNLIKLSIPLIALVPAIIVVLRLVFSENSYSQAIVWKYASFGRVMPYYTTLMNWDWLNQDWARSLVPLLWPIGFSLLFLIGALVTTWEMRRHYASSGLLVPFVWFLFAASLVPALFIEMKGATQLFFLYYGLCALAPIAGNGLAVLTRKAEHHRQYLGIVILLVLLTFNWMQFTSKRPDRSFEEWMFAREGGFVWRAYNWIPEAFHTADQLSPPTNNESNNFGIYGKRLNLSEDVYSGLAWARTHLPKDAVFAVNVFDAAAYAGYSEKRAFLETTLFTSQYHQTSGLESKIPYFQWRFDLLDDWRTGKPNIAETMANAGITHIFIDHVNGYNVPTPPGAELVFKNPDFEIYALP